MICRLYDCAYTDKISSFYLLSAKESWSSPSRRVLLIGDATHGMPPTVCLPPPPVENEDMLTTFYRAVKVARLPLRTRKPSHTPWLISRRRCSTTTPARRSSKPGKTTARTACPRLWISPPRTATYARLPPRSFTSGSRR